MGRRADISETNIEGHRWCSHKQYTLNGKAREARCSLCAELLDPFAILMDYATEERNFKPWVKEEEALRARIKALKADEKRTKARLRNAKKRDIDLALASQRKHLTEKLRRMHMRLADASRAIQAAQNALPSPQESMFEEEDRG